MTLRPRALATGARRRRGRVADECAGPLNVVDYCASPGGVTPFPVRRAHVILNLSSDLGPLVGTRCLSSLAYAGAALALGRVTRFGLRVGPSTTLAAAGGLLLAAMRWLPVPAAMVMAILVLAGGTMLGRSLASRLVLVVPGTVLLATSAGLPGPTWDRWVICVAVGLTAAAAPDIDRLSTQLGPLLITVSALAVYFAVPDTERALVVLGGAGSLVVLGPFLPDQRLGRAGIAAMAALVGWAACFGAVGRPASIIGASAGFGLLLVGPFLARLDRSTGRPFGSHGLIACLVGVQLGIGAVAAKVIGRSRPDEAVALTILAAAALAGGLALADRRTVRS